MVSYLECERFESEADGTHDSLYARASAEHGSQSTAARRSCKSSRPRTTSPRSRPAHHDLRLSADESDSDSDCSHRSVSVPRGAFKSRGASARGHRAPTAVQPAHSPTRDRQRNPLRCDFCRRRGHTADECRRANDLCFTCGASGHFARDCRTSHDDGPVPSAPGRARRPSSPLPLDKSREDPPSPAVMHAERGASRALRRGRRAPALSQTEN